MAKIIRIKDNVVTIKGKENYKLDDHYQLSKATHGVVISAENDTAKLLVIGDPSDIKINTIVKKMNGIDKVEVYEHYFGKIIDPFGQVVHPLNEVPAKNSKLIGKGIRNNQSPAIIERKPLNSPLDTGILAIDTMIPIGLGQRELIIGDRTTGKTSIALSAIINQKNSKTKSIYVSVGQKRNSVISVYRTLQEYGALDKTIIIFANPDSTAQQYLSPTIGMAMAEAIAYTGEDVLIVIDDLTKHANVYREISLSIGRNPGREAYPTDIFYQHSSLLERSGSFSEKYKNGSITCLPIVETVQGDIASLIPSNVISITDGQIFTNSDQFNKGLYPAVDIQLSVSRTGSSVQSKMVKEASKQLKSDHAMLSEIKKFADMSIDISESLVKKIKKWDGINNLLIQYGYEGYTREMIVIMTRMYKLDLLSNIKEISKFSNAFRYFCQNDLIAKKIVERIKKNHGSNEKIDEQIKVLFNNLILADNEKFNNLFTEKEYKEMKGVE